MRQTRSKSLPVASCAEGEWNLRRASLARRPFGSGQTLEQNEVHERIEVMTLRCDLGGLNAKTSKATREGERSGRVLQTDAEIAFVL